MQYTDIALTVVLCSIAQVPAAKTATTPHLIGGKTDHSNFYRAINQLYILLSVKDPLYTKYYKIHRCYSLPYAVYVLVL